MKNTIEGIRFITTRKIRKWASEAKQIAKQMKNYTVHINIFENGKRHIQEKPIMEAICEVEKEFPSVDYEDRNEMIELIKRITRKIDEFIAYTKEKTVEIIRKVDGIRITTTSNIAEFIVGEGVAVYA